MRAVHIAQEDQTSRSIVAAACVVLAVVAPTSASGKSDAEPRSSYIVVFDAESVRSVGEPESHRPLVAALAQHGSSAGLVFQYALKGFTVELTEEQAQTLSRHPRVAHVEQGPGHGGRRDAEPRDVGARPDRPARPAASNSYKYDQTGQGSTRT